MQGSILQLILQAGLLVKTVLVILAGLSVFSWSIIFVKGFALAAASRQASTFARALETTRDPKALLDLAKTLPQCPAANVFRAASPERGRVSQDEARRTARAAMAREEEGLHAYLIFLATTGATAPFIGLLGTVWGIMDAFRGIGATGSATLAVVAPAIAEALITTAAGLAVAIPAVMAYNYFLNQIGRLVRGLEDMGDGLPELVARREP